MSAGRIGNRGNTNERPHGRGKYIKGVCKCDVCRDADAKYQWEYRHPGQTWPGRPLTDEDAIDILLEVLDRG